MMNAIWKTCLNNKYLCFVERESLNEGSLKIINLENNTLIVESTVNLKFNAIPNPEIEDVLYWQEFCEIEIDKIK